MPLHRDETSHIDDSFLPLRQWLVTPELLKVNRWINNNWGLPPVITENSQDNNKVKPINYIV